MAQFISFANLKDTQMDAEQYTLKIDSMAYGGSGVSRREDGKVVFIPMVLPGETVSAVVTREHKSYAEAEPREILVASPRRISAPCPHFSQCGGCDWQHIEYLEQIRLKQEILKAQILSKLPVADIPFREPVVSPREYGYRCHAVVQCSRKSGFETGFFKKRSNSIIPFTECLILNEHSHEILDRLKRFFVGYPDLFIEAMEIHAPEDHAIVRLHLGRTPLKNDLEVYKRAQQTLNLKGLSVFPDLDPGQERVFGQRTCSHNLTVQGRTIVLQSVMGGFIQANTEMNQQLISYVAESMRGSRRIIDLYSGSGNFGIPLSFEAREVLAVEQDGDLVKSGAELIRRNGCTNMRFLQEKALRALKWLDKEGASFDALVLDPPREGAKDVTPVIARMNFSKIIYISCNPSTLARDCALLAQEGFTVKSVRLFDMFPQTFHMESVTVLER